MEISPEMIEEAAKVQWALERLIIAQQPGRRPVTWNEIDRVNQDLRKRAAKDFLTALYPALRKQVLLEAAKIAKTLTPHQGPLAIYDECRRHGELISEAIKLLIEKPSP